MAHIKVERRSMRPEQWTDLRFGWLKRHIYDEKIEIEGWHIREARQVSENEYEFYDEKPRPLNKGDTYFTPDGTAFLTVNTVIPKNLSGKQVWLFLKTAAEMIVKINGKYIGGIDPNRERMHVTPYVDTNNLVIEIEGYNRSKPDDDRSTEARHLKGCRQEFTGGYFVTINQDILDLVYDIEILIDIAKSDYFPEGYRALINAGLANALNLIDFDTMDGVRAARAHIEKNIFSNKNYKGSGNVALIAHSHLDIAYFWRRIHAVQKNARTCLIQMRFMDQYPEFKYTHTQAHTYELLEKYYPELFEELKEKIKGGSFEPVGAMYVEPDCNVPSAESLIRQCLYGQHYFREKFGLTINNCWLPDVFGNSWILPQILKKSGVDYFVSNKMSTWNDTNRFPHNSFKWRGLDGSEVYASVPPTHFITWNMPSQIQENWEAYQEKNTGGQTLSMFGYGDGGSGVTEQMLEFMKRFEKISVMPETEHTSACEYLEKNLKDNDKLEVWDGELYLEMHRGTFTTKHDLKRWNRRLETKIRDAEIVSSIRYLEGGEYPGELLKECYKLLLINQFHDILPGSHITPVYRDAMTDYNYINEKLDEIIGTGRKYFNSLGFKRRMPSLIEGSWVKAELDGFKSAEIKPANGDKGWFSFSDSLETPFYSVKIAENGEITSIYDKELRREWVKGSFNKMRLYSDTPGMYDAWDILPDYKSIEHKITVIEPLKLAEECGEAVTFSLKLMVNTSVLSQKIRFFKSFRGIEFENETDWKEKHKLLKVDFDCNILSRFVTSDLSAGYITRENHKNTTWQQAKFEVCQHKWSDMSEATAGVAIINEGKYGISFEDNKMSLSLLRATVRPDPVSDIGRHSFSYMAYPHGGSFLEAGINNIAIEYNTPLIKSDISMDFDFGGLHLQAMKMAENEKMVIMRLSEQNGDRGTLKLPKKVKVLNMLEDFLYETDTIEYTPFEIITIGS